MKHLVKRVMDNAFYNCAYFYEYETSRYF